MLRSSMVERQTLTREDVGSKSHLDLEIFSKFQEGGEFKESSLSEVNTDLDIWFDTQQEKIG